MTTKVGEIIFVANNELYLGKCQEILFDLHISTTNETPQLTWERPDKTNNIDVFYTLMNNEFLDNSSNSYNTSFTELLQYYREANLIYLLENFMDKLTEQNEFYYKTLNEIEETINLVNDNNITETNNIYFENYNQRLIGINITHEEYIQFKQFIEIYYNLLDIIKQSIRIYQSFLTFQETNIKYTEAHNILSDDVSLNTVFKNNMKSKNIHNLNVKTKLKIVPKIHNYIKAYVLENDWPTNGIFDNEKMSKIIVEEEVVYDFLPPWNASPPPF